MYITITVAGSYTMYSNIEFNEIWGCECGGCVEWGSLSFTKQKPPRTSTQVLRVIPTLLQINNHSSCHSDDGVVFTQK